MEEHVLWSVSTTHEMQHALTEPAGVEDDLLVAAQFELEEELSVIDSTRQALVGEVLERMIHLEQERKVWLAGTPLEIREACAPLHGPLFASYHDDLDLRDCDFLSDLQGGFPLIGRMPELDYAVKSDIEPEDILSEHDLQDARVSNNRCVMGDCATCEAQRFLPANYFDDVVGSCRDP